MNILFLLNNNFMQESILKLPIFLISLKFAKSLLFSSISLDLVGKDSFVKHEHIAFLMIGLYSIKSQSSSQTDKLYIL